MADSCTLPVLRRAVHAFAAVLGWRHQGFGRDCLAVMCNPQQSQSRDLAVGSGEPIGLERTMVFGVEMNVLLRFLYGHFDFIRRCRIRCLCPPHSS